MTGLAFPLLGLDLQPKRDGGVDDKTSYEETHGG
jgi:hypothetical protein